MGNSFNTDEPTLYSVRCTLTIKTVQNYVLQGNHSRLISNARSYVIRKTTFKCENFDELHTIYRIYYIEAWYEYAAMVTSPENQPVVLSLRI